MFVLGLLLSSNDLIAQEEDPAPADRPVSNTFNGSWIIDNQSVYVHAPGTFGFDILHRFGTMGNGYDDLFGLYAP